MVIAMTAAMGTAMEVAATVTAMVEAGNRTAKSCRFVTSYKHYISYRHTHSKLSLENKKQRKETPEKYRSNI